MRYVLKRATDFEDAEETLLSDHGLSLGDLVIAQIPILNDDSTPEVALVIGCDPTGYEMWCSKSEKMVQEVVVKLLIGDQTTTTALSCINTCVQTLA